MASWLSLVTGLFVNYATQLPPAWSRNPAIILPALAVLSTLSFVEVVTRDRRSGQQPAPRPVESLRPPKPDVPVRGRGCELRELDALAKHPRGRFAVICGPGGIGKTTLAKELAAQVGGTVWWFEWSSRDDFADQIAAKFDLPRGQPDLVWDWLVKRKRWLLVIDKLDQPEALDARLWDHRGWVRPGGGGLLLITSRNTDQHAWGRKAEATLIELDPLSTKAAESVLLDAAREAGWDAGPPEQARALADRLGGFPLALRLASRAMFEPTALHRRFGAYREALDAELGATLAAPHGGPLTEDQKRALLRYTWELSLDQLADEGHPLARPLLRMLSLTADAPLPRDLITAELLGAGVTHAEVNGAVAGLRRYGLIGVEHHSITCVTVLRLVREINALLLADQADVRTQQDTLDRHLLADADRTADSGADGWGRARLLAPHLAAIPDRLDKRSVTALIARDTLDRVADTLHAAGDVANELRLLRAVLVAREAAHGPDHVDTLGCRNDLAVAVLASGAAREAVVAFERVLADYERVLGPEDPRTLGCRSNLAVALHSLDRHAWHTTLFEQVLADREHLLGRNHADTLASRNNLAEALRDLGQLKQAAELHERTLADRERVLGPDNPDTLTSRENLAYVLKDLRRWDRAVELFERIKADTGRDRLQLAAARAELKRQQTGHWWSVFRKRRQ